MSEKIVGSSSQILSVFIAGTNGNGVASINATTFSYDVSAEGATGSLFASTCVPGTRGTYTSGGLCLNNSTSGWGQFGLPNGSTPTGVPRIIGTLKTTDTTILDTPFAYDLTPDGTPATMLATSVVVSGSLTPDATGTYAQNFTSSYPTTAEVYGRYLKDSTHVLYKDTTATQAGLGPPLWLIYDTANNKSWYSTTLQGPFAPATGATGTAYTSLSYAPLMIGSGGNVLAAGTQNQALATSAQATTLQTSLGDGTVKIGGTATGYTGAGMGTIKATDTTGAALATLANQSLQSTFNAATATVKATDTNSAALATLANQVSQGTGTLATSAQATTINNNIISQGTNSHLSGSNYTGAFSSAVLANGPGGTGSGAVAVTVTVTDGTTNYASATVAFTQGVNRWTNTSGVAGTAAFSLDTGTYTLAVTKTGYSYTPASVVVAATNSTFTATISAIVISPPSDPTLCTVAFYARYADGTAAVGYSFSFRQTSVASANSGNVYTPGSTVVGVSDSAGLVEVELPRSSVWRSTENLTVTVPDAATYLLPSVQL